MQADKQHYFVYIFGEQPGSDVQIGIADDLRAQIVQRNADHAQNATTHPSNKLVYYEHYDVESIAQNREHQIKSGGKDTTYSLIASMNPNWLDLSDTL
ncbi:excinuclease ABC subunit C [Pontibacter sp. MBLB2868]|uniref:excinuclease ABC subunit C n=1 Tax=Pontibacter sp. MBLB2868 TaxID=3451555 RepID=UPI003F752BCC